jgi:hypothetical protein
MKYLKKFNESIKNIDDDVIQTIKDILLPISDMGYEISVSEDNPPKLKRDNEENFPQLIIRVVTFLNEPLLVTNEVKEDFIRMKEYLESEGFNSLMAHYLIDKPGMNRQIVEFDDFINKSFDYDPDYLSVRKYINNLLFVAKHSYLQSL